MCGVVGLLLRDPDLEPFLGSILVPMIGALAERGPDSSGIALYADAAGQVDGVDVGDTVRVSLGSDFGIDWDGLGHELDLGVPIRIDRFGAGVVVQIPEGRQTQLLEWLADQWPDVRVLGIGRNLSVLKDTGWPTDTCVRYGIDQWQGYLALAHTRMATESAVTVLHSHPFVPMRDLCVVHNGSFSNHATVRRRLQAAGVAFQSDNDSEVAARYLASRLESGDDLAEATGWVMKEMDGFFTLVIASATGMSVVRDAFAGKPAVVAETEGYVAVASEYRALAELPDIGSARIFEPQPEEVYTWSR